MPINTTNDTLSWFGGKIYLPGAEIPDDLASALGILVEPLKPEEASEEGVSEEPPFPDLKTKK